MGTTTIDLFRSGSSGSPQLDKVRISGLDPDVDTFTDHMQRVWVIANGKGVSSSDAVDPTWTGKPWRLPAGSTFPDVLQPWEDEPGHWAWEPVNTMLLTDYQDALASVHPQFVKV
jgi:hypothetical protein